MPAAAVADLDENDNELYENEEELEEDAPRGKTVCNERTDSAVEFQKTLSDKQIAERCVNVLNFMKSEGLDLTTFLWHISWNNPEAVADKTIQYARTGLMWSTQLPEILENWYRPPRQHGRGVRTKAARAVMDRWAVDAVKRRMNREMRAIRPHFTSPQQELSEETLLEVDIEGIMAAVKCDAPTVWSIFHSASWTPQQEKRNKVKSTDMVRILPT